MPSIALCEGGLYYLYVYYVYILKSKHFDEIYTGVTSNLKNRLSDHNRGKSLHTKKFKPWKLATYIGFDDEKLAKEFELYLKTGSGIAFARKHFL